MDRQRGAALIIGLIFLILLSIVGLSSIRSVTLQEKIIGNNVDGYRAKHNADIALLTAEENVSITGSSARTLYLNAQNNGVSHTTSTLWDVCDDATLASDNLCENLPLNAKAKYETTTVDDIFIITVKAQGSAKASVMLQSTIEGKIIEQR
ncbi:MAG: PilX N-terminal domain-containing pilus assembly protein [Oceanospirillaceae bacterium]